MTKEYLIIVALFVGVNAINILLNTFKSVLTVKGTLLSASAMSAITYWVYTYANIITVNSNDINIHVRAGLIGLLNFVFVFLALVIIEKMRKDKLWKVEVTIPTEFKGAVDFDLREVPHSYIEISPKHTLFNFYCATQKESIKVKEICDQYGAKYFATEAKIF